mgnify:CR=1 FL=1
MKEEILNALKWRYSVRSFDTEKKVSEEDLRTVLEGGRLAPSSFGLEPWKFLVVENRDIRERLQEVGYGQEKISKSSHLIVIASRTDVRANLVGEHMNRIARTTGASESDLAGLRGMIEGKISSMSDGDLKAWIAAQAYISLGMMLETAALLGIDAAPMEGFVPEKFDEILGLGEKNLTTTVIFSLGFRGEDPAANQPKVRKSLEEAVEFVK